MPSKPSKPSKGQIAQWRAEVAGLWHARHDPKIGARCRAGVWYAVKQLRKAQRAAT